MEALSKGVRDAKHLWPRGQTPQAALQLAAKARQGRQYTRPGLPKRLLGKPEPRATATRSLARG
eukprot:4817648-Lingulodinium_polyedra.AAC.1